VDTRFGEGNIYVYTNVSNPGWKGKDSISYSLQDNRNVSALSCMTLRRV